MSDKRELILDSALQLFTTRGFHNTPTSLIAKNAGVANGTLFNHFKSKEELINQLYLECKSSFNRAIVQALQSETDIKEQIHRIWNNVISWAINNPGQFSFFQQYRNSPFIKGETRDEGRQLFSPLINFLNDGMANGIFKKVSLELLLGILLGIMISSVEVLQNRPENIEGEDCMEEAFNMLWDSIKI